MQFNDYDMLKTAEAVIRLNEYYAGRNADQLVDEMKSFAMHELHGRAGYAGTGGWYVVTYVLPTKEIGCTAMVAGWLVEGYFSKKGK